MKTKVKNKYSKNEQTNFLALAHVGATHLCAGYNDRRWIRSSGFLDLVKMCDNSIQCLIAHRNKNETGRVSFLPHVQSLQEIHGIILEKSKFSKKEVARSIRVEDMLPNDERPDFRFAIKWKVDEEQLWMRGVFMGKTHDIARYDVRTEVAQRLIDILKGERSLERLITKKLSYLQQKVQERKLRNYTDGSSAPSILDMKDIKSDISSKLVPINKKITEIVSENLYLEGIPEKGSWAYKFDTKGDEVGVGTFIIIEKEE